MTQDRWEIHLQYVTAMLGMGVALGALGLPLWFGRRKPGYSHLRHTISELGEVGAPDQWSVAYYGFLPIGIGFWLWLWLVRPWLPTTEDCGRGLLLLAGMGLGYVGGAFFRCDPGAPYWGSRRNRRHNLFAGLGYIGGGLGLLTLGRCFGEDTGWTHLASFSLVAGWVLLVAIPALSWQQLPIRGLVQRMAEGALFAWVLAVALSIGWPR